jgi:hypothetical protein
VVKFFSRRNAVLILLSVAIALTVASSANAALFKGQTSQGEDVGLRTDGEGVPTRLWLKKFRADCKGDAFFRDRGYGYIAPFDKASASLLYDASRLRVRGGGATTYHYRDEMRARRRSEAKWSGKINMRIVVRKHGRHVNTCRERITFAVRLVR